MSHPSLVLEEQVQHMGSYFFVAVDADNIMRLMHVPHIRGHDLNLHVMWGQFKFCKGWIIL